MNSFFPMRTRERVALFVLIGFSVLAFLPVFGEISLLGVAAFGWLMAILLLGSPAILLLLLLAESGDPDEGSGHHPADPPADP
ncbi:MAG: hypothetical protein F4228_13480 [Acidobacteria bacterium]|nr:hypothetical protein [Acidobacteriota bacterium]MYF15704.1 hypothetical protein [Acidobacteriota bacterium]MYI97310.1 hypothetical protein [Acidobacteriota bacterium]